MVIVARPECPVTAVKYSHDQNTVMALSAQGQPLELLLADRADPAPAKKRATASAVSTKLERFT
jgi:hypothetical protein